MKILAIIPHPDDATLNAGGALARWAAEGHEITTVCCTAGDVGTLRRDQSSAELGAIRTAELRASDAVLGIQATEVLGFPDGGMLDFRALREALARCVRKHRPQRVVTMDPWARYEVHSDHIDVGKAASEAAAFACFPLLYPKQIAEGLEPHNADEVWYMGLLGDRPNTYVNIEGYLSKKVEAVLKFEATLQTIDKLFQHEQTGEATLEQIRQRTGKWLSELARRTGRPVGLTCAEAFMVQRCLPGHFDNMNELIGQMLGEQRAAPRVIR